MILVLEILEIFYTMECNAITITSCTRFPYPRRSLPDFLGLVCPSSGSAGNLSLFRRSHPLPYFVLGVERRIIQSTHKSLRLINLPISTTNMPKVGKNKRLKRVARRAAASDPLPTATTTTQDPEVTTKNITNNTEDDLNDDDNDNDAPGNQAMSRGQRKRQAKREQFLKKEKLILSTLMLQKREDQKRRIDGLDAIRDALLETTKETSKHKDGSKKDNDNNDDEYQPTYGTNRAKKGIMTNEIERMNLVMEHPAFKEDPFGAIQEHLRNTLAGQKEKRQKEAKTKAIQDKVKQEHKKNEKKERLQGVKKSTKKYKTRRCK